ncbi:hypothetical protein ACSBR2_025407 [Camellia fascicularis]
MSMKSLYIAFFLGVLVVHSCMFELAICSSNYTDQLSFLAFKSSIDHDPNNVSTNWTKEINFCNWAGVLCSRRRQRVTSLHLGNMGLRGTRGSNLNGNIPSTIGEIERLQRLHLSANNFHRSIPSEIFLLRNLGEIYLQENKLSGSIPSCIIKICSLQVMDISSNKLTLIPSSLWNLENLRLSNLSFNSLNGSLDPHKALKVLESMDLSWNRISGSIPRIIGSFQSLTSLNLSRNSFSGPIPNSIRNLVALDFLDLSLNKLSGPIPKHRRKNVRSQHSNDLFATIEQKKVSYQELQRATTDFCEANLLGKGSYGSVYKGVLSNGTIVAIKILNLQVEGAFRSFNTECEVLRTKRHRNLVRVITTCSNPELRALVLQYMSNGSLDKWLYSHNWCLNFFQRVSIIIDVSLALEYLHDGQSEPVVHCNLKPSNVLLDEDMIAHVADFGIAKILAESKTAAQTNTLGTLGYIAPGYGSGGRVSTKDRVMEIVDGSLLRTEDGRDVIAYKDSLLAIMEIGVGCCADLPECRTDIKDVVFKLNKIKLQLL